MSLHNLNLSAANAEIIEKLCAVASCVAAEIESSPDPAQSQLLIDLLHDAAYAISVLSDDLAEANGNWQADVCSHGNELDSCELCAAADR